MEIVKEEDFVEEDFEEEEEEEDFKEEKEEEKEVVFGNRKFYITVCDLLIWNECVMIQI